MASIYEYLAAQPSIWDPFNCANVDRITVSEIWKSQVHEPSLTSQHKPVDSKNVQDWLERTRGVVVQGERCLLRSVWVTRERMIRHANNNKNILESLAAAFGQELAQKAFKASLSDIASVTPKTSGSESYFFCHGPKLAVTWSKDVSTGVISIICIAETLKIARLKELLDCRFIQALAHEVMTPALLCAVLLSREVDERLQEIKTSAGEVEARTGYHNFASRNEAPARGDLLS